MYLLRIISSFDLIGSIPIAVTYPAEWKYFGPDKDKLAYWAELTGGRLLRHLEEPVISEMPGKENIDNKIYQHVNGFLIICALVLLIIDLVITKPFSY